MLTGNGVPVVNGIRLRWVQMDRLPKEDAEDKIMAA
jgi:hypothetical protein